MTQPYPSHWPRPDRQRPTTLASRITEQQKLALYNRVITTRHLAAVLNVHERYLSALFSSKVPIIDKKPLIEARKAFKLEIAKQVNEGKYTTKEGAKVANVTYKTMRRFMERAKNLANDSKTGAVQNLANTVKDLAEGQK